MIDDGSTDGSGKICDEFALSDNRIHVFHTDNHGLGAARNFGLDHLSEEAEFVAFLDSDDWAETNMIQTLYEAATRNKADLVCCLFYREFKDGSKSGVDGQEQVLEGEARLKEFLCHDHINSIAWNKLYRAELIRKFRFPEGRIFEDIYLTYKIIDTAERVVLIPDHLIHYRIRDNSLSQNKGIRNLVDNWDAHFQKYKDLLPVLTDTESKQKLTGSCINAISQMIRWYYGLPKEERINAKGTLNEMQVFVKDHYKEIMRAPSYTKLQKLTCYCAKSMNPLVMKLLHFATKVYLWFRNEKRFR